VVFRDWEGIEKKKQMGLKDWAFACRTCLRKKSTYEKKRVRRKGREGCEREATTRVRKLSRTPFSGESGVLWES